MSNNNSTIFAPNYPRRASTMDSYCEAAKAKKHDAFFDEKWDYKKENRTRAKRQSKMWRIAEEV